MTCNMPIQRSCNMTNCNGRCGICSNSDTLRSPEAQQERIRLAFIAGANYKERYPQEDARTAEAEVYAARVILSAPTLPEPPEEQKESSDFLDWLERLRDPYVRDALFVGKITPRERTNSEDPSVSDYLENELVDVLGERKPGLDAYWRVNCWIEALRNITRPSSTPLERNA